MNALVVVSSITTVVALAAFVAIVFWAYSSRRKKEFDDAAQAPFLLPDDTDEIPDGQPTNKETEQRGRQP